MVCVGTPPKQFDLIVDTGSALTAFPCSTCTHCGEHKHGTTKGQRFSTAESRTSRAHSCTSPPLGLSSCRTCDAGSCGYTVSYTEGSSIRGHFVTDVVRFSTATGQQLMVNGSFGCQNYESGLFYSQVADGITGFSQSRGYGLTLHDALTTHTRAPQTLSICLSDYVGALSMGGRIPQDAKVNWIPFSGSGSYVVPLSDLTINGKSVGLPAYTYANAIIDSGTTFCYLPSGAYQKVAMEWRTKCPWGDCRQKSAPGEYPDDYCYKTDWDTVSNFAQMSLHFSNGVALDFGPRQYAYELKPGLWCMGVFDNSHAGAVIGGANMRNHEVIFDRDSHRVAFVPSDCQGMYNYSAHSLLEGGYGLSGCEEE